MALLKTYSLETDFGSALIASQLYVEIVAAGVVEGFTGVNRVGDQVFIEGTTILDENALDTLVSTHVPDLTKLVASKTVQENKKFSDEMMQQLKLKNILEGLSTIDQAAWVHHRLRKVDYTLSDETTVVQIDVMNLVVSGDIETADAVLGQMSPDSMSEPYHWWTQDRINWVRNEIRTYLGWPTV